MEEHLAFGLRLLIATLLGGIIGLQRELSGKPAGLRTNLLICLGAALLTQLSLDLASVGGRGDPARLAAQIVSGIGFLGAGTIIQARHVVHGLTSAATIWVVAAVGMAVGAGYERRAILATALILLALIVLGRAEQRLLGQEVVSMTIETHGAVVDPHRLLADAGLHRRLIASRWHHGGDAAGRLTVSWRGVGDDARALTAAVDRLPGAAVVGWEVEE